MQKTVKSLGYIVSEFGIETEPDKIDKLPKEKCFFMKKIVKCLGHIVSEFGIETHKTKKVKVSRIRNEPRHDKINKMSVCPAKTQISLGTRPVRSRPGNDYIWK